MSLEMTREEREAFLADLHVGIIAIHDGARPCVTEEIICDCVNAARDGRVLFRPGTFNSQRRPNRR